MIFSWLFFAEIDQCLLTVIHCPGCRDEDTEVNSLPAQRLGCLQQFVAYKKVQCASIPKLTLPRYSESQRDQQQSNEAASGVNAAPENALNKSNQDEHRPKSDETTRNESTFLKRVRSFVEERRARKRNLAARSGSVSSERTDSVDAKDEPDQLESADILRDNESERNEVYNDFTKGIVNAESETCEDDTEITDITDAKEGKMETPDNTADYLDEIEVIDDSEVDKLVPLADPVAGGKGNTKQRLLKMLKSSSFSSVEDVQRRETLGEEKTEQKRPGLRWKFLQKMRSLDVDALRDKDEKMNVEKPSVSEENDDEGNDKVDESSTTDSVAEGIDAPTSDGKFL